jgi:hypothetical protein
MALPVVHATSGERMCFLRLMIRYQAKFKQIKERKFEYLEKLRTKLQGTRLFADGHSRIGRILRRNMPKRQFSCAMRRTLRGACLLDTACWVCVGFPAQASSLAVLWAQILASVAKAGVQIRASDWHHPVNRVLKAIALPPANQQRQGAVFVRPRHRPGLQCVAAGQGAWPLQRLPHGWLQYRQWQLQAFQDPSLRLGGQAA